MRRDIINNIILAIVILGGTTWAGMSFWREVSSLPVPQPQVIQVPDKEVEAALRTPDVYLRTINLTDVPGSNMNTNQATRSEIGKKDLGQYD